MITTETFEAFAERMVRSEVQCCVTSLVSTLAGAYGAIIPYGKTSDEVCRLTEQAVELAAPVLDYAEAAREAGWEEGSDRFPFARRKQADEPQTEDDNSPCVYAGSWEEACEIDDIEPHEWEVYEHWAVSTWFAEKLAEHGEKVDTDFAGLNVWARTTMGQGIAADAVVLKIARECMEA